MVNGYCTLDDFNHTLLPMQIRTSTFMMFRDGLFNLGLESDDTFGESGVWWT